MVVMLKRRMTMMMKVNKCNLKRKISLSFFLLPACLVASLSWQTFYKAPA